MAVNCLSADARTLIFHRHSLSEATSPSCAPPKHRSPYAPPHPHPSPEVPLRCTLHPPTEPQLTRQPTLICRRPPPSTSKFEPTYREPSPGQPIPRGALRERQPPFAPSSLLALTCSPRDQVANHQSQSHRALVSPSLRHARQLGCVRATHRGARDAKAGSCKSAFVWQMERPPARWVLAWPPAADADAGTDSEETPYLSELTRGIGRGCV